MARRLLGLISALFLALTGVAPLATANSIPDEQWTLRPFSYPSGGEYQGLQIRDDEQLPISVLVGNVTGVPGQLDQRICRSAADAFCDEKGAHYEAIIPVCEQPTDLNCIRSLDAVLPSGTVVRGVFKNEYLPKTSRSEFAADLSRNLPRGAYPSVWTIPGVTHGGGTDEYLGIVRLRGGKNDGSRYGISSYNMSIAPFTRATGAYSAPLHRDITEVDTATCAQKALACGRQLEATTGTDQTMCASVDTGLCALRQAFPADTRFRLTIRLSQSPTGWFHGRVQQPDITIAPEGGGFTVSIEGKSVQVPVVGVLEKYASLPSDMQDRYAVGKSYEGVSGYSFGEQGPTGRRNQLSMPQPDSEAAFTELSLWSSFIKDRASASPTVWTIRTLTVPTDSNACFRDSTSMLGVVTTNAMVYAPGPPVFTSSSGTLDYRVASPHLTSQNETFLGTYDLAMKASVAQCVYGFKNAPVSATVSVVSADGNSQVATTNVNVRDSWLYLSAYGFTFSAPTVRVKLLQPQQPTPAATSALTRPKSTTIACIKGKQTKRVTAIKPKCPNGWKKKA